MKNEFGTTLNCIDGRTQLPIINWLRQNYGVDYVDSITEPGIDKILSHGQEDENERLKEKVKVSVSAHNSHVVAIVGHYGCAANPVSECEHLQEIVEATNKVKSWGLPVEVIGLWVDEFWQVHVVGI